MRIDSKSLGIATALTVVAVFTLCSIVVALIPDGAGTFVRYALHLDITGLARKITWGSFSLGLLFTAALGAVAAIVLARIYNQLTERLPVSTRV